MAVSELNNLLDLLLSQDHTQSCYTILCCTFVPCPAMLNQETKKKVEVKKDEDHREPCGLIGTAANWNLHVLDCTVSVEIWIFLAQV